MSELAKKRDRQRGGDDEALAELFLPGHSEGARYVSTLMRLFDDGGEETRIDVAEGVCTDALDVVEMSAAVGVGEPNPIARRNGE